jgi:wyosine [tRNA(Phe)-imidazoG37] synthetase (radical SAM superfamily)
MLIAIIVVIVLFWIANKKEKTKVTLVASTIGMGLCFFQCVFCWYIGLTIIFLGLATFFTVAWIKAMRKFIAKRVAEEVSKKKKDDSKHASK